MSLFKKKGTETGRLHRETVPSPEQGPQKTLKEKIEPFLYLFPFMLGMLVFTLYPLINVFFMAFKNNFNFINGSFTGWGIDNFKYVIQDPYFSQALGNTFKYVFTVVPIGTALSIVIANLLNQKIRGMAIFHTAYFLPMVTSSIAVGIVWRFMFNYDYGIVNYFLNLFGVDSIKWLSDPAYNFPALAIYGIWSMMPFTIILLLSGLQNIDPQYYTAARVDGAKTLRIFWKITIPLLLPTIFLTMIVNGISAFKTYNELFPLFRGPGFAFNLFTVVYYIYYQYASVVPPKYGRAAAAADLLFIIIFIFTRIQLWFQNKFKN